MYSAAATAGITVKKDFIEKIQANDLYPRMKNIFEIAVSVSPLLILVQSAYKKVDIRRDHFIAVCLHRFQFCGIWNSYKITD
jgi:hypothetical protein